MFEEKKQKTSWWKVLLFILLLGGVGYGIYRCNRDSLEEHPEPPVFLEDVIIEKYTDVTISYYSPSQGEGVDAFGVTLLPDKTCAVNPALIPYNSIIYYNDMLYLATDTGNFTHAAFTIGICSVEKQGFVQGETITVFTVR